MTKTRYGIELPDGYAAVQEVLDFWQEMNAVGTTFRNFREAAQLFYAAMVDNYKDAPSVQAFETITILEKINAL